MSAIATRGSRREALRAILGGTFDPVHVGHLHAALVGGALLDAERVELLLAARPRHRGPPGASVAQRWAMLKLATADANAGRLPPSVGCRGRRPRLVASDRELTDQGASRTVATLEALLARGEGRPVWLLGADALAGVHAWHRAHALARLCHLLVLSRPGQPAAPQVAPVGFERMDIREFRERRCGGVHFAVAPMLDISATGIRAALAAGRVDSELDALLTPAVWAYIRQCALYPAGDAAMAAGGGSGGRTVCAPLGSGQGGGLSTRHK